MFQKLRLAASALRADSAALARRADGSVAIEFGMGAIVFVVLITGLVSFGSIFFVQGAMADAARDAARRMALGEMTPTQAETHAQAHLINWGMTYVVNTSNDGTDAVVTITVPMRDAAMVDYLGLFAGNLSATATMAVEP